MNAPGPAEAALKRLIRSRAAHRGVATKYIVEAEAIFMRPLADISESEADDLFRLQSVIAKKMVDISDRNGAIEEAVADGDLEDEIKDSSDNMAQIQFVVDRIQKCIDNLLALKAPVVAVTVPSTHPAAPAHSAGHLNLPKLNLPQFSGSYTEWVSFYDLFKSSVDSNTSLSNCQKLQYLKSSLKGDAARLLTSLQITDANYTVAKDILVRRYKNIRAIARAHVHALCTYPALKQESGPALRKLLETVVEHRMALQALGQKVDDWDLLLVYHVSEKLDPETRRQWELASPGNSLQKFAELHDFLEIRCRALEASSTKVAAPIHPPTPSKDVSNKLNKQINSYYAAGECCPCCKDSHRIYSCPKLQAMSVTERSSFVQRAKLCFNCLRSGHPLKECKSDKTCRECNHRHHTLLHKAPATPPVQSLTAQVGLGGVTPSRVILATALVPVLNQQGQPVLCRGLLDPGSEVTFISETCTQRLGLKKVKQNITLSGIGDCSTRVNGAVHLTLSPDKSEAVPVTALVLPKLTKQLPSQHVSTANWTHIQHVKLADPLFAQPGEIDLILGADIYELLLLDNRIREIGSVYLRETVFGWIVSGATSVVNKHHDIQSFHASVEDATLRRFWELEELPAAPKHSNEEAACERHFLETTTRDQTGRFIVKLPFKDDVEPLGDSLTQAQRRFSSLERRFATSPKLKQGYTEFIQDFLDLGHMEEVPVDCMRKPSQDHCYLPHHCVFKDSSTTTKIRVVFDGSAKTASGTSLNESLLVGPKIQDDLFDILLRFRFHCVALSGDIAKMYRQFSLAPPDRDFHRVLWRDNPDQPIKHYRMTRVTYGIASAAFHSVRSLHELAKQENDPLASPVILTDFYIDDLLSGAASVEDAKVLQDRLIATLERGGCELRKWTSSHSELVTRLPEGLRESADSLVLEDYEHSIKTLGIRWRPASDSFYFNVAPLPSGTCTKRGLLSDTAKLFDPMGWLAPVIIKLKCFMQQTWMLGLDWDEPLPGYLLSQWLAWRHGLSEIEQLSIPRYILAPDSGRTFQLHVFCDASEVAYAAAIYLRTEDDQGNVKTHLLASKTRVAPVKTISIPRLELCGALLASRLTSAALNAINQREFPISEIQAWTDSTIVLAWLAELPRKWSCFVANRVSEIQSNIPPDRWRHVSSGDNPADCASRGLPGSELVSFDLWWYGPVWLQHSPDKWPTLHTSTDIDPPERRPQAAAVYAITSVHECPIDINRFSSLKRLIRSFAFSLRFIHNLREPDKRSGPLQVVEIAQATRILLKHIQQQQFSRELSILADGRPLPNKSKLLPLAPFLDKDSGLLKVGGRLSQSDYPESTKHPVLLDKKGHLVQLLVQNAHKLTLHGGALLTLSTLRQEYWILGARDLVRQVIHRCVRCIRFNSRPPVQIMGDLPEERITANKPFTNTGLDFAGPLLTKTGSKSSKVYVALFVCFSTKAIHLELVSALTKDACIAALRRFIARRGLPRAIYSDNGTNFVGAKNELVELQRLLSSADTQESLANFAASTGIEWVMIPPRAPHFGGLWEAGVKSMKLHLRRIVGNTVLTFEELSTILAQVEAVLNSRPLTELSSDPNDVDALTPGHFLVGAPLTALPEAKLPDPYITTLKRFQLVQALMQSFWKRWRRDYLSTLQTRKKWTREGPQFAVGDLVLIAEDNSPPLHWTMGRITQLFLGNDEVPRVAEVRTAKTTFTRPVVKLRLLPVSERPRQC